MDVITKFISKSTVLIRAYVYNINDTLVDPTSVKVTLVDKDGTKKIDDLSMSKSDTGIYDYYYTLASDAAEGWWNGEVWVVDGAGAGAVTSPPGLFSFEVKKGL